MKHLLLCASIVLLTTLVGYAQPKVGDKAPDITMQDVNGRKISLSDLKGKVVLIDFWASWCGPCRKAMPGLRKTYAAYKSKGFEIYGISLDEKKADWKKAIKEDGITWLQVNEPGGWESKTAAAWHIDAIPAAFLLDKERNIIAVDPTESKLNDQLKTLLP